MSVHFFTQFRNVMEIFNKYTLFLFMSYEFKNSLFSIQVMFFQNISNYQLILLF